MLIKVKKINAEMCTRIRLNKLLQGECDQSRNETLPPSPRPNPSFHQPPQKGERDPGL